MYSKTTFQKLEGNFKIEPENAIYTCGSCFALEFYERLSSKKFNVISHPFGIVFNPISIAQQFAHLMSNYQFKVSDLVYHNGLYHSMDHHGSYSNYEPELVIDSINKQAEIAYQSLKQSSCMVITLGSAHQYKMIENHKTVANCHKFPSSQFTKSRIELNEIIQVMEQTFIKLNNINTQLKIIISVSPVRYLKDGFIENARSKASLLLAAEYLCVKYPFVNYFPAYEIFMDDLRDYRYVKDDLVHPNKMAVDYIWSYFEEAYLSEKSKKLIHDLNQFYQMLNHRILNAHSLEFESYISKLQNDLNVLEKTYKYIDFTIERNKINAINS